MKISWKDFLIIFFEKVSCVSWPWIGCAYTRHVQHYSNFCLKSGYSVNIINFPCFLNNRFWRKMRSKLFAYGTFGWDITGKSNYDNDYDVYDNE